MLLALFCLIVDVGCLFSFFKSEHICGFSVKGEACRLGFAREDFTYISVQVFEMDIYKYIPIHTQLPHPLSESCINGIFRYHLPLTL